MVGWGREKELKEKAQFDVGFLIAGHCILRQLQGYSRMHAIRRNWKDPCLAEGLIKQRYHNNMSVKLRAYESRGLAVMLYCSVCESGLRYSCTWLTYFTYP